MIAPLETARPPSRFRLRFTLRTLLALVALASITLGILAWHARHYGQQQRVGARLSQLGGLVVTEPRGPDWLRSLTGDRLHAVTFVVLFGSDATSQNLVDLATLSDLTYLDLSHLDIGDDDLVHLLELDQLRVLYLSYTRVTDAALQHLLAMRSLYELDLTGTQISDEAVERLQQALPQLDIDR